nr:MAG TPA: NinB protein [Caudoviricetes sp.]
MIGNAEAIIQYLFHQDREKVFEVREYKQKRSLTQNAYFWVLVNEIANVTRQSKDDIHLQMLKEYGQNQVISVQSNIDISKFIKYFEEIGHGRVNGKDFTHYRVFEGSSEMDSREMAILLDGVVQEAEQLGIPTLTPAEIARLKP